MIDPRELHGRLTVNKSTVSRIIRRIGRSNLFRFSGAILVVQLLFWLVIKPVLIDLPQGEFETLEPYAISEAAIAAPNLEAATEAVFKPVEAFGGGHCCDLGYRALRYSIDLESVPEQGLGLYPNINTDNLAIYVNGQFVAGEGDMTLPRIRYGALLRKIYHVQPSALEPGRNEFTFLLVRDGVPYFDYNRPLIGEYGAMTSAMSTAMFFAGPYKYMALAAVATIAFFAFIVLLRSNRKTEVFWFFLLAASWSALSLYYIWIDRPMHGAAHMSFYFCTALLLVVAWFGWADSWSKARMVWPTRIAVVAFVVLAPVMVASLYLLPSGPNYDTAGMILDYAGIAFGLATIGRIAWGFRGSSEDRYWEAAIMILLALLLTLNALTELTHAINMGFIGRTQPFLIIAFAAAFFARNYRLFQSSAQISALLQSQLDERTAELARAHARETELVRLEAHGAERQRILRDMHDGLGSQLMSMLMMAKRGKASQDDIVEGVQSVIDEMRLMIDSMDSVGESLSSALAIFRRRMIPRIEGAGFACDWQMADDCPLPDYGPRDVLQVFRILQEAVTNALKHSGGDRITIRILPGETAAHPLRIAIADNGSGLTPAEGRGRGLGNMQARARSIDARLEVSGGPTGTQVTLDLPETRVKHRPHA